MTAVNCGSLESINFTEFTSSADSINMYAVFVVLTATCIAAVTGNDCWWSGCQPKSWAQRGCYPAGTWKQVGSQACDGNSDKYHCCRNTGNHGGGGHQQQQHSNGGSSVNHNDCWWSGCQPNSWAQKGCFPADTWQQTQSQSCGGNSDKYKCCRKIHNGGGGGGSHNHGGGQSSGNCFVSFDEFKNAVTWNGYPSPPHNKYQAMCGQASSAGGIASKQELAMFLAQILHESGGLVHKKEIACAHTGCPGVYDSSVGAPGKNYYGRGYMQLSHSYNYKAASQDLYHDLRLIHNPDLVSDDENVAWATTFWYWRTRVRSAPNVLNFWFGSSTRAINGALECNGGWNDKPRRRFEYYKKVLSAFNLHVNPIDRGCYN